MADSMDLVQQRVEENLQRHIHNPAPESQALPAFFASTVTRQYQRLADKPFRACSVA